MEDAVSPNERSKSVGFFMVALLGLLLLYVLSVGPVALILNDTHSTPVDPGTRAANIVYAPLIWLDHEIPSHPLSTYAYIWIRV